ncbi:parafibromin [Fistulifera solaris]|uniref:Parafibromin n=1 Tax=Fistulifera solaris TaxID=1519565 RepID=A0A1Z5JDJ4_FISSO|nr:parafibromin [Fistulifera solaris]|eukprot:GAX11952.1 parafibromin [Fistulifera solaris]
MTEAAASTNNPSAASEAVRLLQEWTQQNMLPQVVFENDTLQYSGHKITANTPLAIADSSSKSCTYSAASLFLQLLHPGLIQYRNECKKYNVIDPVKATDKAFVVAFFSAKAAAAEVPVAAIGVPTTITTTEPPPKKPRKEKSHHTSKSLSSSSQPQSKLPKPLVTNEQLFDRLNVVVDKRQPLQLQQQADDEEQRLAQRITKALNADGFAVTPELLQEHAPRTELILQQEIPVGNSASILRAVNPQKDLSRVVELFQEATKGSSQHHSHNRKSSSKVFTSPTAKPLRTHLVGQKPVILVPKGMTAPLTLVNAHEFLANAKYVPREKMVQQNQHRNPLTTFTRPQEAGRYIEYEIMDNPRKLGTSQAAWDRVVAVIVLGQSWQFKDWLKGYQTPATLFDQVYGFFVSMEGDQLPPEVATWAVHVATLNRDKRGLDQVAYATFWNGLEEFIRVRKPELFM